MSGEPFNAAKLLYLLAATLLAATLWPRPPPPAELSSNFLNQPIDQETLDEPVEAPLDTDFCPFADSENRD